jgi:hypothetical protein
VKYEIVPLKKMPKVLVMGYWESLLSAGRLATRLSDVHTPSVDDVVLLMGRFPESMFFVLRKVESEWFPISEFTLTDFIGNAARIHFSMSPDLEFKNCLKVGREVTDSVLNNWYKAGNPDEAYLSTLIGLTPVPHRRGCLFALKSGFEKQCVIPQSGTFQGDICDMMLSLKVSNG